MVTLQPPLWRMSWASIYHAHKKSGTKARPGCHGAPSERTYKTGGTGAEHQNAGSQAGADLVQAMAGAGSGLEEGGIDIIEVVNLEDLACGVCAVFGEATVHGDTVGLELEGWEECQCAGSGAV